MSDQEIYEKFIEWLRTGFVEAPAADELLPMISARYTPEEAKLCTGMPFDGPFPRQSLEELAEEKGMDPAELAPKLDALAKKGGIFRIAAGDTVRYSLNDVFFTFLRSSYWAGSTDDDTRTISSNMNTYFHNGFFDQWKDVHIRGLRTLPIEETIEDTRKILPYEEVVKVLDSHDLFCVATCPCRHRKNVDPEWDNCEHSDKHCMHFGELARYMIDQGMATELTREEAREDLKKAADDGLVHGINNWQEGVDTICNCCQCCCMWFESYHKLNHKGSLDPSNYRVAVTPESCIGCGLCVKRCPMDALSLEDSDVVDNKEGKAVVADIERCIGCGVCVHKCPSKSLVLEHCGEVNDPPGNIMEFGMRFMSEKHAAAESAE